MMKGTYCLLINLKKDSRIKIGNKLSFINFKSGYYIYVGSAMNSLEARLNRHLSDDKKKHWHIDYLLLNKNSQITDIYYTASTKKVECEIARNISPNSSEIDNFGSSDCECNSHLFYFENIEDAITNIKDTFKKLDLKIEIY